MIRLVSTAGAFTDDSSLNQDEASSDLADQRRSSTSRPTSIRLLISHRRSSLSRPGTPHAGDHHTDSEEAGSSEEDRFPLNIDPSYNTNSYQGHHAKRQSTRSP